MQRRIRSGLNEVSTLFQQLRSKRLLSKLSGKHLSTALIVLGSFLLLFVLSQYGRMQLEQRRLARQWEEQEQRRAELSTATTTPAIQDDGLTRLVIPKIDLTSFVIEGTNHKSLLLGPGHMQTTAIPGDLGNAVITGHRDTFFRHIHELEKGDQFFLDRGGKRYIYEVTGKRIVEPDDMSVTRPTTDSQVTLITCYPTYYIGPAPKRLVVFSKLANQAAPLSAQGQEEVTKAVPHLQPVSVGVH